MSLTVIPCAPIPRNRAPLSTVSPDLAAIKTRPKATWAAGNFAVVGTTLQIVGESLCEAVDLQAGERVLDVACGNGNSALSRMKALGLRRPGSRDLVSAAREIS
jgi:hypothetical protein